MCSTGTRSTTANRLLVTLDSDRGATTQLTYARLRIDALALAAGLVERGYGGADAVAIMLPTGSDFFAAFYGALYAGCVPVPLYPPARLSQLEDHLQRLAGIIRNAEARVADHAGAGQTARPAAARAIARSCNRWRPSPISPFPARSSRGQPSVPMRRRFLNTPPAAPATRRAW
jgi:acyl-CoA synthetase (AMP-forming)/AMP-acid ligase II